MMKTIYSLTGVTLVHVRFSTDNELVDFVSFIGKNKMYGVRGCGMVGGSNNTYFKMHNDEHIEAIREYSWGNEKMKYENYNHAKFVCETIKDKEKLLDDLLVAEEVRFQLPSGYHIKTIQCGVKCEPDYTLDALAKKFKSNVIAEIRLSIEASKQELERL